jgi:hypothetical protein
MTIAQRSRRLTSSRMRRMLAMLQRLSAAHSAARRAMATADRYGFSALRWARLWVALMRAGADERAARRAAIAELIYQRGIWVAPPMPAWAAALVPPAMTRASDPPPPVASGEVVNLRRLVLALDASRHEPTPLSIRARDWAGGQSGLGERWADGALTRLGELGVLTKRPGVRRLPTWHLPVREEALRRLDDALEPART